MVSKCIPRTCGVVPMSRSDVKRGRTYPSHTRGCSRHMGRRTRADDLSSAHAGLFPSVNASMPPYPRIPRARGVNFYRVGTPFALCSHPCSIETMTSPNTLQFHNKTLWAKTTDRTDTADGFPLHTHLADVTGMVDWVIARWVSPDTYNRISSELGCDLTTIVKFCAAAHDLGKPAHFFSTACPI